MDFKNVPFLMYATFCTHKNRYYRQSGKRPSSLCLISGYSQIYTGDGLLVKNSKAFSLLHSRL